MQITYGESIMNKLNRTLAITTKTHEEEGEGKEFFYNQGSINLWL